MYRFSTVKHLKKAPSKTFDMVVNLSEIIRRFSVYLGHGFEFRISPCLRVSRGVFRTLSNIYMEIFEAFQETGSKILKNVRQIYLRFIIYCSRKCFYDRTVFHNTGSSCIFNRLTCLNFSCSCSVMAL